MDNKYCVISVVGKNSLHKHWIDNKTIKNFDLHLIVYDDSIELFRNDCDFICNMKGQKLKCVYNYINTNNIIDKYEYFFIPDDDILITTSDIIKIFDYMKKYNLKICQPSLVDSFRTHKITIKNEGCILRYVSFVEMMCPCFSRNALKNVLFTFNENESGWGADCHWDYIINEDRRSLAILDVVNAKHTKRVSSHNEHNQKELCDYLRKYNIKMRRVEYNRIPI